MSFGQKTGQDLSRTRVADGSDSSSLDRGASSDQQRSGAARIEGVAVGEGVAGVERSEPPVSSRNARLATIIRLAIGLLLLTSAGFKIYAIFTEPYFADSILGSPLWMVGLVECEILLGLWLISGFALRAAWLVALIAFVGFAGVNTYLLATGATTCGCFGTVETHPWVMLGLDLAVLAALVIWRPRDHGIDASMPARRSSVAFKHFTIVAGLSALMLGICATWLAVEHGSVWAGIMSMRGEVISIEPANITAGNRHRGESVTLQATLRNHSAETINIVGGTTSCKCLATKGLPLRIAPHASMTIPIVVRFVGDPGPFRQQFVLFTDTFLHTSVRGRVNGNVLPSK